MGEVSVTSENATEKMNGDINGACDEDEAMDVDSQSQDESVTTSLKEHENTTADEDNDSDSQQDDPLGGDENPKGDDSPKKDDESEKVNGHGSDDDDNAVIIHSDSDSDVVATDLTDCEKDRNGTEVHEILSDKEDCVVIEDPKDQMRRSGRQRKSLVKVRDYSNYEDDDIEEIMEDPLTERPMKKSKMLPQDLSVTPVNRSEKKEPTLVIIDTNTMLNSRTAGNSMMQSIKNASSVVSSAGTTSGYSVTPVGVPAQGVYPPNIRATITPVAPTSTSKTSTTSPAMQPPLLLPALTDDMFVLEAPSFIVPYIYEKPPEDDLKEVVQKMSVELEELRKKEEAERGEESDVTEEGGEKEATEEGEKSAKKSSKRRKKKKNPDDSWDESDTSTDEEASDSEERTKVLIKEAKEDLDCIKKHIITPETAKASTAVTPPDAPKKTSDNYFESPLGQFFMTIGINLVQEHVQTDLLRLQKKKRNQDSARMGQIQTAINSLMKNLEISKVKNEPFKFET